MKKRILLLDNVRYHKQWLGDGSSFIDESSVSNDDAIDKDNDTDELNENEGVKSNKRKTVTE